MPKGQEKFTKTSFRQQADVISSLLRTNPILNEEDKRSMQETVGVLHWLNQIQLGFAEGKTEISAEITEHIFGGRKPQSAVAKPEYAHSTTVEK